jgi:hypothetical protein
LCEVAPDHVHPTLGEKVLVLLDRLADPSRVVRLGRSALPEPR